MTALVRVRKHEDLVQRIDDTGLQVEVAEAAGLSIQRVNQLYTGSHTVIEVRKARALEDALGVPHGALFEAVDGGLLAPYVHSEDEDDPGTGADPPPVDIPPTAGTPAA